MTVDDLLGECERAVEAAAVRFENGASVNLPRTNNVEVVLDALYSALDDSAGCAAVAYLVVDVLALTGFAAVGVRKRSRASSRRTSRTCRLSCRQCVTPEWRIAASF